jgi:hypothetical protein
MKREECFKIVNLFDELDELQKCLRDFRLGVDCALGHELIKSLFKQFDA